MSDVVRSRDCMLCVLSTPDVFCRRVLSHPLWAGLVLRQQHDGSPTASRRHACNAQKVRQAVLPRSNAVTARSSELPNVFGMHRRALLLEFDSACRSQVRISIQIKPGALQILLRDFQVLEFLDAHDDYICRDCGDSVQQILRVQPVGRALLFCI